MKSLNSFYTIQIFKISVYTCVEIIHLFSLTIPLLSFRFIATRKLYCFQIILNNLFYMIIFTIFDCFRGTINYLKNSIESIRRDRYVRLHLRHVPVRTCLSV